MNQEATYLKLNHPIHTSSFLLRGYQIEDYHDYASLFFSNKVMEAVGGKALENYLQFDALLKRNEQKKKNRSHLEYLSEEKVSKEILGEIGIKFKYIDKGILELSYLVKEEHWGKGVASECVLALVNRILELVPGIKVQAQCSESNFSSQRVLDKCNFVLIGLEAIGDSLYQRYEYQKKAK